MALLGPRANVSMMVSPAYRLVSVLLHAVYVLFYYTRLLVDVIRHVSWAHADTLPALKALRAPNHLAVVFAWTNPTAKRLNAACKDVLRLATWCAAVGTSELTVYDADGLLARAFLAHKDKELCLDSPLLMSSSLSSFTALSSKHTLLLRIHVGSHEKSDLSQTMTVRVPCDHVYVQSDTVRLNMMSQKDDKQALVQAINSCGDADLITPAAVNERVLRMGPMRTVPEVLMLCDQQGGPPCLHGFPCWLVRLTMIGALPSWSILGRWTSAHFMDTLRLYTAAEQRHGA